MHFFKWRLYVFIGAHGRALSNLRGIIDGYPLWFCGVLLHHLDLLISLCLTSVFDQHSFLLDHLHLLSFLHSFVVILKIVLIECFGGQDWSVDIQMASYNTFIRINLQFGAFGNDFVEISEIILHFPLIIQFPTTHIILLQNTTRN